MYIIIGPINKMEKKVKIKSAFSKETYRKNAELYKVMANPKRLEILNSIVDREVTVNELSKLIGIRKSNTSQHLAYLRYVGLVTTRRQGKNVFYKITNPKIVEPCKIFNELRASKTFIKASQII
jgi:DNA-binding transcriptional ArsR family regulator